ncbi:MAG: BLUF domain-containing protein [Pseudomonadota bacterium]
MPLAQLIYTSRPFGFDEATLDDILTTARVKNAQSNITGALICRADLYMQMLEGPRQALTETFGRILRDDRHVEVRLVHCADTSERLFPQWSMRDDPPQSWMWNQAEVRAGAARLAPSIEALGVFRRLATLPKDA